MNAETDALARQTRDAAAGAATAFKQFAGALAQNLNFVAIALSPGLAAELTDVPEIRAAYLDFGDALDEVREHVIDLHALAQAAGRLRDAIDKHAFDEQGAGT